MTGFDTEPDPFGLAGTFPRPGWVVLDAARDHRFTGELVVETDTEVRIYLDRGTVYMAERVDEPSLGARLVDAGALNAAQLEHGAMRVGQVEHLGRLFERVPSVDRQFAMVITELMNEACVADVAGAQIDGVVATPYRHHPAGVHHWHRTPGTVDPTPGDPLPAPTSAESPVSDQPPESLFDIASNDTDLLVQWDEPSWLDDGDRQPVRARAGTALADGESWSPGDWADRLETDGLPETTDPLARPAVLPTVTEQLDRFEVIWPSGDVDENFGTVTVVEGDADRDRVGPTARINRPDGAPGGTPDPVPDTSGALWDVDEQPAPFEPDRDAGEDAALTTRRAVASIDTGSLDARRRLAEAQPTPVGDAQSDPEPATGTSMTRATPSATSVWSARPGDDGSPSVFDEPVVPTPEVHQTATAQPTEEATSEEPQRVGALKRLIGSLRRR